MLPEDGRHYDDSPRPLDLDQTIRTVICTSYIPPRGPRSAREGIGEHKGERRTTSAPDRARPHTGALLYSALIVLRPGRTEN